MSYPFLSPVHRCRLDGSGFEYSPDRKDVHPQQHPEGTVVSFRRIPAVAIYNTPYENGCITEAACMAHARRKIHGVHACTPTNIIIKALKRIGDLYVIKAEMRGCHCRWISLLSERQYRLDVTFPPAQ